MADPAPDHPPRVVIAGFGVPGRTLAEQLKARGIPYVVIELNKSTVERCGPAGVPILQGDASSLETLARAGVADALFVALMVPDDAVVLEAVRHVRQLNPTVPILARCAFTSAGLEAIRRGATETIVAEQIVAREAASLLFRMFHP